MQKIFKKIFQKSLHIFKFFGTTIERYDFVDMEYVFGMDSETYTPTMGIPFYTFYKKIGTSQNGNTVYAKTYVPAIEVSGLEAYFQNQTSKHSNSNGYDTVN